MSREDVTEVRLADLVERVGLEVVLKSDDYEEVVLKEKNVNRPGLQLTGFMEAFPWSRLQIIGNVEYVYYMNLEPGVRYERMRGILSYPIPALLFSYNQKLNKDILDLADYYNKTILRSPLPTTRLIAKLNEALEDFMAPRETVHAGLMDIFGSGVLIRGKSGVGKSEAALGLLIRGHRLVADDVVNIKLVDDRLIGEAPANIRHYMEIRGLGILDIRHLYGVGSVKEEAEIELVVDLEEWDESKEYDRLGIDEHYTEILGKKAPLIVVPVKPGRNVAMIIEAATRNNRAKSLGYNAAVTLNENLIREAKAKARGLDRTGR